MTEIEKAYSYIQILKQEGKLDENVLSELLSMYNISEEEAQVLLDRYKKSDEYKINVSSTIKEKLVLLIASIVFGGFFLFATVSRSGSVMFGFNAYLFLAVAVGLLTYLGKLLTERYTLNDKFPWLQNTTLPLVIFALATLIYTQYLLRFKTFLYNKSEYSRKIDGILLDEFQEISFGGKYKGSYYQFSLDNYATCRWYDNVHKYAFNSDLYPMTHLKKGDSLTVFVNKNFNGDYFEVGNIAKNGIPVMDIKQRDKLAEEKAIRQRNIMVFLSIGSILLFLILQMNIDKKPS